MMVQNLIALVSTHSCTGTNASHATDSKTIQLEWLVWSHGAYSCIHDRLVPNEIHLLLHYSLVVVQHHFLQLVSLFADMLVSETPIANARCSTTNLAPTSSANPTRLSPCHSSNSPLTRPRSPSCYTVFKISLSSLFLLANDCSRTYSPKKDVLLPHFLPVR
jgi:hypothetical protein